MYITTLELIPHTFLVRQFYWRWRVSCVSKVHDYFFNVFQSVISFLAFVLMTKNHYHVIFFYFLLLMVVILHHNITSFTFPKLPQVFVSLFILTFLVTFKKPRSRKRSFFLQNMVGNTLSALLNILWATSLSNEFLKYRLVWP